jgi:hypothetical protein
MWIWCFQGTITSKARVATACARARLTPAKLPEIPAERHYLRGVWWGWHSNGTKQWLSARHAGAAVLAGNESVHGGACYSNRAVAGVCRFQRTDHRRVHYISKVNVLAQGSTRLLVLLSSADDDAWSLRRLPATACAKVLQRCAASPALMHATSCKRRQLSLKTPCSSS